MDPSGQRAGLGELDPGQACVERGSEQDTRLAADSTL